MDGMDGWMDERLRGENGKVRLSDSDIFFGQIYFQNQNWPKPKGQRAEASV